MRAIPRVRELFRVCELFRARRGEPEHNLGGKAHEIPQHFTQLPPGATKLPAPSRRYLGQLGRT